VADFRFFHPIEVRYGDLDPQGHVNNAKYLTYFEQARISYITHLGLWDGASFLDVGMILADIRITFRSPVLFTQKVRVGVRTSRLGNKSLGMDYRLDDAKTSAELASGSSVQVAYDYRTAQTIPIPARWREAISAFEGLPQTE
jgi:acyl-CoA thioester hydrolase